MSKPKTGYKIPYTLDPKFGDVKTPLKMENGQGFDHTFTVRSLLTSIVAIAVWVYLVFNSQYSNFFQEGSWPGVILFTLGYFGSIYFSLREISIPGLYGYNVLGPLVRYLKRLNHRDIRTESFQHYRPASAFVGMVEPDQNGHLRFRNGDYGMLFKIIGTASYNAFSIDRDKSIVSFEDFLRTLPPSTTYCFITNTGGQNVDNQLKHLFDEYDTETDQNILDDIAEEIRRLGGYVQNNFVALHQFLIIRGDNLTALNNAVQMTRMFIDQGQPAIISMTRPTAKETTNFFKPLYSGLSEYVNKRLEAFRKDDNNRQSELDTAGSLTIEQSIKKGHRIKVKTVHGHH